MKQLLTTLALLIATSMVGQTSVEEFIYADKGYRLLIENGLPTREDLRFQELSKRQGQGLSFFLGPMKDNE